MSEVPSKVIVQGSVSGQIAVGKYINQFQNLHGCTINIASPKEGPVWERTLKSASGKPRPPGLFLDRVAEIQTIEHSIQLVQPVTVNGEAGIGKSTLLKQVSHLGRSNQFIDGTHFLPAYSFKMEDLLQNLFSIFYTSNPPAKPNRSQMQELLYDIRALLIIDDLDLNPDELQVVLDIAPNCMFVVASTQQILQSGLRSVRLGGLPEAEALTLFEAALGRTLTEQERQIVCEISEMLHGHPEQLYWLAATAREGGLSLPQVREKIKKVSMQGYFQETVQSMPDRQKRILAILAAIGSRSLPQEHLAGLLPEEPIRTAINDLAARGLVKTQNQSYQLGESFAGMLTQSWGLAQWEQSITRYFVNWLRQNTSWQALSDIRDVLWVLMEKAAQRRDWSAVISLGRALEPLFLLNGYWQAWYVILQYILGAARNLANSQLEGWALHQLGSRSLCLGANDQAASLLQQAANIRKAIGDQAGLQVTQHNLGLTGMIPVTGTITGSATTTIAASMKPLFVAAAGIFAVIAAGAGIATLSLFYTPRPPILIQPVNEFTQQSQQYPAFEWQRVSAGATYQIQVDDQADFSSPVYDQTLRETSLVPGLPLGQGSYYWHVRANRSSGRQGPWSETRQFTVSIPPDVPSLVQPPDQFVNTNPTSFTFIWTPVQNAASYQIQVDDQGDFSSPVDDESVTTTQYAPARVYTHGTYAWRVRALNSLNSPSDWSKAWTFTISVTPGHIQLLEPANGSKLETTATPSFNWQNVDNAVEYEIQVDDNPDFNSPQYDTRQPESNFLTPAPLPQNGYFWRVRALNEDGRPGDWSEAWSFIVSIPPAAPTLTGPPNDSAQTLTSMPPLTWTAVSNAATYELQMDDSPNFDSVNFSSRTAEPAFRLPSTFSQGMYYWQARALNVYGTASGWSTPWRLTVILPPNPPVLLSPFNGSRLEPSKPITFAWQSVPGAGQYQIQVDNTSNFSSPEYQSTTAGTSSTANQVFQTGPYFWRVQAVNAQGIAGGWSEAWSFTIPLPAPILESPDPHINTTYPTTFTWLGVQNASQYEIQVDDDQTFMDPIVADRIPTTKIEINSRLDKYNPEDPYCNQSHVIQFFWRVRAIDSSGTEGYWSMSQPVNIDFGCGPIISKSERQDWGLVIILNELNEVRYRYSRM